MASLLATLGMQVPIQPTTLSYTPAVRSLVVMLAFGACALYPVGRAATARGAWSPQRLLLDAAAMSALFTVVFWPLQLVTYWPRGTGLAVWCSVLGWTWVAVAATGFALEQRSAAGRALTALAVPALMGLGAALDALGTTPPLPALCGPAVAVLELAPRRAGAVTPGAPAIAAFPWILACAAWAALLGREARAFAGRGASR